MAGSLSGNRVIGRRRSRVPLIAPPCPVVDADNAGRGKGRTPAPSNDPQQSIVAHRQHKSTGKTRRWAATQRKAKVMDDKIEPCRPPRPRRKSAVIEAFSENALIAQNSNAAETARHDHEANRPPRQRQIGEAALIPAMNPPRTCSASRTETRVARGMDGDHGRGAVTEGALHVEPARD